MDIDVGLCCFGMEPENGRFLDTTYYKEPRYKFVW
jgi:hypothetical protein